MESILITALEAIGYSHDQFDPNDWLEHSTNKSVARNLVNQLKRMGYVIVLRETFYVSEDGE
jgi:hypothetical protein